MAYSEFHDHHHGGSGIGWRGTRLERQRLPRVSFATLLFVASLAVIIAALLSNGIVDRFDYSAAPSSHVQER